jgi:alpha-L-fucosidase 2
VQSKRFFLIFATLGFLFWALAAKPVEGSQQASIYTGEPGPLVSVNSLIPPDDRVTPMPLAERIRLAAVPKRGMCSTIPASNADNGLISGDGKMWVQVYGDPFAEQIVFDQENLLQPWKGKPLEAPKIASVLPEVRKLLLEGEYKKALDLSLSTAEQGATKPGTANLSPHPAFDMHIDTPNRHEVQDYLRTTDFESGEVKVVWRDQEGVWERRTFVSRPDNVVVQLLTAPSGAGINTTLRLDTSTVLRNRDIQPGPAKDRITIRIADGGGQPLHLHNPGAEEVRFNRSFDVHHLILQGHYVVDQGNPGYASVTRVIADGGSVEIVDDSLVLKGVHSLTLITRIEAYPDLRQQDVDALKSAVDQVPSNYADLLARHRIVQASVMDRASVDFGGTSSEHFMSGEEMLTDQRTRFGYNPALLANMFDMGRYWLYMRSGDVPPMWGHVNINVNLQMSGAVMGDLPEAMKSYVDWVEGQLPDARTNAMNIFGARGALFAIHPTESGGPLTHFDFGWPHQYWISAGGWMYSPIWDYYLATGDKQFLREHVMPGLKEIGLFYEDYLKETDKNGNYIFVPSYSPENYPRNSERVPAVINATMDISVCREVFTHLIAASQILGVDADNIPRWKAILAKLPPYLSDTDGALKEWAWPTLDENLDHRHVSHLYGAWPGDEFTPDSTPDLAHAALLADRKRGQGNASAHGIFHRALAAARLKDAYLVNFDLKQILEQGYVNPSLTTMHNPYAIPSPDPQGALPTLIMEMLVYSRPGIIGLLPAEPDSLTHGEVKGILCRTQAKIDDLKWNMDSKRVDVTISSHTDQTVRLFVRRGIESITAPKDALVNPVTHGAVECNVRLYKAHPVTLHFTIGSEDRLGWAAEVAH